MFFNLKIFFDATTTATVKRSFIVTNKNEEKLPAHRKKF
jgi:hypothetical protein